MELRYCEKCGDIIPLEGRNQASQPVQHFLCPRCGGKMEGTAPPVPPVRPPSQAEPGSKSVLEGTSMQLFSPQTLRLKKEEQLAVKEAPPKESTLKENTLKGSPPRDVPLKDVPSADVELDSSTELELGNPAGSAAPARTARKLQFRCLHCRGVLLVTPVPRLSRMVCPKCKNDLYINRNGIVSKRPQTPAESPSPGPEALPSPGGGPARDVATPPPPAEAPRILVPLAGTSGSLLPAPLASGSSAPGGSSSDPAGAVPKSPRREAGFRHAATAVPPAPPASAPPTPSTPPLVPSVSLKPSASVPPVTVPSADGPPAAPAAAPPPAKPGSARVGLGSAAHTISTAPTSIIPTKGSFRIQAGGAAPPVGPGPAAPVVKPAASGGSAAVARTGPRPAASSGPGKVAETTGLRSSASPESVRLQSPPPQAAPVLPTETPSFPDEDLSPPPVRTGAHGGSGGDVHVVQRVLLEDLQEPEDFPEHPPEPTAHHPPHSARVERERTVHAAHTAHTVGKAPAMAGGQALLKSLVTALLVAAPIVCVDLFTNLAPAPSRTSPVVHALEKMGSMVERGRERCMRLLEQKPPAPSRHPPPAIRQSPAPSRDSAEASRP